MEERQLRGTLPLNRRKPIRLPRSAYASHSQSWHVILSVKPGAGSPFSNAAFASVAQETIVERCIALRSDLLLSGLMPDHVHLLLVAGETNLPDVISDIKSHITRASWTFGFQRSFWQRRFYDHGIRGERDYLATVTYILENPVRAELVDDWETYPWLTGSLLRS